MYLVGGVASQQHALEILHDGHGGAQDHRHALEVADQAVHELEPGRAAQHLSKHIAEHGPADYPRGDLQTLQMCVQLGFLVSTRELCLVFGVDG